MEKINEKKKTNKQGVTIIAAFHMPNENKCNNLAEICSYSLGVLRLLPFARSLYFYTQRLHSQG